MTRLTSRASVLAALDLPAGDPLFRTESTQTWDVLLAGPSQVGARRSPLGYEIWESARRQAEFYATYAEMLETGRRPRGGEEWVQEAYPDRHWVGPAALASSYRLAAQHAALVDARWATRLAVRAGMAYVAAGLPFGLFLLTGLLDDQTLGASTVLRDLVEPFRVPDASDAVRHPVQLTYLLLAAASRPWLRDPLRQTVSGAEQRLTAHSLYPIGAQGVPIGAYLELANAMRYDDEAVGPRGGDGSARDVTIRLAALYRTQATALRAAQRNRYLWRQGASAVAIIELEQVAMSGLALRHRPWFGQLSAAITAELDRDDDLAQLPVWTMGSIDNELPSIAPSVTEIMREPDRAWRSQDFREPDTGLVDPWHETASPSDRNPEETQAEYPGFPGQEATRRGPDTSSGPLTRRYPKYGDEDEDEDDGYLGDGDDPYFPNRRG